MADWSVEMNEEKDRNALLNNGWHDAKILKIELVSKDESKSKNPYFHWFLMTDEGSIEMRTTLLKGKRWLLKQTLEACGIAAKEDDPLKKYSFSKKDVEGKTIKINIINRKSEYINNSGEPVEIEKSEINQVKRLSAISSSKSEQLFPDQNNDLADF